MQYYLTSPDFEGEALLGEQSFKNFWAEQPVWNNFRTLINSDDIEFPNLEITRSDGTILSVSEFLTEIKDLTIVD